MRLKTWYLLLVGFTFQIRELDNGSFRLAELKRGIFLQEYESQEKAAEAVAKRVTGLDAWDAGGERLEGGLQKWTKI